MGAVKFLEIVQDNGNFYAAFERLNARQKIFVLRPQLVRKRLEAAHKRGIQDDAAKEAIIAFKTLIECLKTSSEKESLCRSWQDAAVRYLSTHPHAPENGRPLPLPKAGPNPRYHR